jgi:hypothetical protein
MVLIPLFPGLPGGAELLTFFVLIIIPILFLIGRWVYHDATARGSEWAWQWGVGIAILFLFGLIPGLLGLIIYLLLRGEQAQTV